MGIIDLFRLKWKHSYWFVRLAEVKKFENQLVLEKVAKTNVNENLRMEAVKKIDNQTILAEIAKSDKNRDVRKEAVERISDQNILAEIAESDKSKYVRKQAVEKIKDPDIIAEIAESDEIRKAAKKAQELTKKEKVAARTGKSSACIRCNRKLITKRYFGGGTAFGVEGYEAMRSSETEQLSRVAYKCRNCGALQCRSCAERYSCEKCGSSIWDIHITSDR